MGDDLRALTAGCSSPSGPAASASSKAARCWRRRRSSLDDVAAVGEGGLLGIAVHPDFASNRFVFLAYTARLAGGGRELRVVRYREVGGTLGEPMVILDRIAAADIHDGARVKFGPDRKLYVTMGDVANPSTAQDLGTLTGKILRLNDDGTRPGRQPVRRVADLLVRASQPAGPRLACR